MKIVATPLVLSILLGLSSTDTRFVDGADDNIFVSNVFGGTRANPGDYPYFVQYNGCGGALIAPDMALSAAHCGDRTGEDLYVGAYRTFSTEAGAQIRTCVQYKAHPGYDGEYLVNDVSLCKLASPVTIDESKVKLELNRDPGLSIVGESLVGMGFGLLGDPDFSTPEFLQRTDLQGRDCFYPNEIVCAGGFNGQDGVTDVCRGDSGGPLVRVVSQSSGPDIHYHVGAVSFGDYCPAASTGMYARTSALAGWIDQAMCEMNSVGCRGGGGPNPTPTQTPQPPTSPPVTDCQDNQSTLVINVRTDQYPEENEWLLQRQTPGGQWVNVIQNALEGSEQMFTTSVCLESDTKYRWTLTDTLGDGLCDLSGNCGSFSISLNGAQIVSSSGDNFEFEFVQEFTTPPNPVQVPTTAPVPTNPPTQTEPTNRPSPTNPPTVSTTTAGPSPSPTTKVPTPEPQTDEPIGEEPTGDCQSNQSNLVVSVRTDMFSYENEWLLERKASSWMDVRRNDLDGDERMFTTNVCLDEDTLYRWTITDIFGDGLCDSEGNCGSFLVTLDGQELVSSNSNGNFEFDLVKEFKTPLGRAQPQTDAPSVAPSRRRVTRQPQSKRPKNNKKTTKKKGNTQMMNNQMMMRGMN